MHNLRFSKKKGGFKSDPFLFRGETDAKLINDNLCSFADHV